MNLAHVTAVSEAGANGLSVDADVKEEQGSRCREELLVDDSDVDLKSELRIAAVPISHKSLQQAQIPPPSQLTLRPSMEQSTVIHAGAFQSRPCVRMLTKVNDFMNNP